MDQLIDGHTFSPISSQTGGERNSGSAVFARFVVLVIFMGVQNGIERVSRIMMPVLVVLAVIICIYAMTEPGAMEGVKYLLIPNFKTFLLDDGSIRHGTDVLLPVDRDGYPGHLRLLHEERHKHR